MDENLYLTERLDDQINWYDRKSAMNKKWHQLGQTALIILAVLVTLSGMITYDSKDPFWLRYVVPVIGALIALITGVLSLNKYQENWMAYRTTSETLKHEKFLFLTKTAPYDTPEAFNRLVNRVETLISKENSNWQQSQAKQPEKQ